MDESCAVLTWHWAALNKGIALHSLGTTAIGNVVKDLTNRIGATNSGTGIDTLVADTSSASIAVRVQNTLGTAAGVRVTVIFRQTRTYSVVALGVGATRRGVTRVLWRQWILDYSKIGTVMNTLLIRCQMVLTFRWWFGIADAKRITDVARQTTADGSMVDDIALGVEAT